MFCTKYTTKYLVFLTTFLATDMYTVSRKTDYLWDSVAAMMKAMERRED